MGPFKSNKNRRPNPMTLLPDYTEGEADQDRAMEASWGKVMQEMRRSPGYKLLLSQSGIAAPRLKASEPPTPTSFQSDSERGESTTKSDDTIKQGGMLESGGVAVTPTPLEPQLGGSTSPVEKTVHSSVPQFSLCAPAFQPAAHLGSSATLERLDTPQEASIASRIAESDPRSNAEAHCSTPEHYLEPSPAYLAGVSDMGSPLTNSSVGGTMGQFRLASPAQSVPQLTPPTRGLIHQRRASSKFSFVPVLPSPLGPGHYTDDLGSDVSGLVSPAPKTAPLIPTRTAERSNILVTAPASRAAVPAGWTRSTLGIYAPFDTSPASDPFVERELPAPTTPTGFTPLRRKAATPPTPSLARPELQHPTPRPSTPQSSPAPAIPSPSPTRLTDRTQRRKEWLETATARLTTTARTFLLAKQKHEASQKPADYLSLVHAQAAFLQTWDLDSLVEERRNATMPAGMKALRAGVAEDGMGGVEGKVLGGRMAVMERVCAEVVGREGQWGIEAEELDEGEKVAVRKAVVNDVRRAIERRVAKKECREERGVGYQP